MHWLVETAVFLATKHWSRGINLRLMKLLVVMQWLLLKASPNFGRVSVRISELIVLAEGVIESVWMWHPIHLCLGFWYRWVNDQVLKLLDWVRATNRLVLFIIKSLDMGRLGITFSSAGWRWYSLEWLFRWCFPILKSKGTGSTALLCLLRRSSLVVVINTWALVILR